MRQSIRRALGGDRDALTAVLGWVAAVILVSILVLTVLSPPPAEPSTAADAPTIRPSPTEAPTPSSIRQLPTPEATAEDRRLGIVTWRAATRLDLTGWYRPPDGLELALLAAQAGGVLPGTWNLLTTPGGAPGALRPGLIAVLPSDELLRGPDAVALLRTSAAVPAELLDRAAELIAAEVGGEVTAAIDLPSGPARVVRYRLATPTHGTIEVIEYVILTSRRLVVLEFGADWRRFDEFRAAFRRVAASVRTVAP